MIEKQNWESIPTEEVTPSMHRKIVSGEKLMIAKMKFKDGFIVPLHRHTNNTGNLRSDAFLVWRK